MEKGRNITGHKDMLFREKKKEGIRNKIIPIVEKTNTKGNRNDNLTEKERKGMISLKERKKTL